MELLVLTFLNVTDYFDDLYRETKDLEQDHAKRVTIKIAELKRLKQTRPITKTRGVLFVDWISDKRTITRAKMVPWFA